MIIFGSGIGALIGLPFLIILFLVVVILLPITGIVTLSGKKDENGLTNDEIIKRKIDAINFELKKFKAGEYVYIERERWSWYKYYRIENIEMGIYREVKRLFGQKLEVVNTPKLEMTYIGDMYNRRWEYFEVSEKNKEYVSFEYGRNYCYAKNLYTITPEDKKCYRLGIERIEYEEIKKIPGFTERK